MLLYILVYIETFYYLMAGNLFLKHKVNHIYGYALFLLVPYILVPIIGEIIGILMLFILEILIIKQKGNSWLMSFFSIFFSLLVTNSVMFIISLTPLLENESQGVTADVFIPVMISFILSYMIIKVLIIFYCKHKSIFQRLYRSDYFKISMVIFVVGLIFLYFYGTIIVKKYLNLERYLPPAFIFFIYVFLLTLVMLSIAYAGIHAAKKKEKEKQYLELEGYTQQLEVLHKNISGFKHDYVNILSALMGYIESEDYKGLKNHLTHVISPYSQQIMEENESFSALMMVNIPSLKGLLTVKLLEIYKLELKHNVEIVDPIETIHMDLVDLSRMFGILMDNAIEAASLTQEKYLGVALVKTHEGVTIIVENACPEDMLPIHAMYEEKKTTKGPSRGLGLYHYKEMAKTYKNVLTETLIENKVFKQVLTIHNL